MQAVEAGLRNGEFFLEYMPIVELDTGQCVGAEALSRWGKPSGVAYPAEFLPVIESTHLHGYLTHWVLEAVARDFLEWLKDHDGFISFNVPPEIIGRGGLLYLAERTRLVEVKHRVVVEITERGVPDRLGIETLNHAAGVGIRLALDDVGADANAIVLSRCKVEMIKIDRSLVAQMRPGEPLTGTLASIASLARSHKLCVVAEGVESADQACTLKEAGIPLAQGFYFSPPLRADAFKAYFASQA
jgi:EAL domain-containing protein (putative c-di-GMP-specific phosphodiesterase class I)